MELLLFNKNALFVLIPFLAVLITSDRVALLISVEMRSVRFEKVAMVLVSVLFLTVESFPALGISLQLLDQIRRICLLLPIY